MKIDRLLGILTVLLQKDNVTAPFLAERFEVSRRTISRDIDALCQAGIPIVTRQGGGGGISIAGGYKLDKSVLTTEELSSMIAALKGLGSVTEKSQAARMLDKISSGGDAVVSLRESVIIDLASHYKGSLTEKIELIKKAVREQRLVEFDYYYEKGEGRRRIEPYFVIFQWTAWYLFGYCLERDDWRMFKLTRLWDLRVCGETYISREIPPEKRDFNASLPDDKKLVALFDPEVKYQLIDSYGLNCYSETEGGRLLLEIGYTNTDYMISWLLGFGGKVRVLEPAEIADGISKIAEMIIQNYK